MWVRKQKKIKKKKLKISQEPMPEDDVDSPGTFTPKFDTGPSYVANGKGFAYWVRDELNCTAVALKTSNKQTLIMMSVNVYMIFRYWKKKFLF